MSAKAKKGSKAKNAMEKYPAPDPETLDLTDETYMFKCALGNDYQNLCGAFDATTKEIHPLAAFILEKNLFNTRDVYHKSVFDLACLCGNKEFMRAVLERTAEKEKLSEETVLNLREPLKQTKHGYNYMHYACIWNRMDVVKFLVEQDKMIIDPEFESDQPDGLNNTLTSASSGSMTQKKENSKESAQAILSMKTLGSILLRSHTRNGETPRALAKRYKHQELVDYLIFAGNFIPNFIFSICFKKYI
jgi:ankyrin repeat protein